MFEPAHDHRSDRRLVGAQAAIIGRLPGPRGVQESRLFRCRSLTTSRVPKTDPSRLGAGFRPGDARFSLVEIHVFAKSLNSEKKPRFKTWRLLSRIAAQNPCDDVGQLVVVADARLRPLHDEFVAAVALGFADMHLSAALRTGLSPRGRGCVQRHRFVRLFGLQFFHPLFVGLRLSTLRMHSSDRIRNLATNRADFSRRCRVHRAGLFLIHGNLLVEFVNLTAWYQPRNRDSIRLAKTHERQLKEPRSEPLVTSRSLPGFSHHAKP